MLILHFYLPVYELILFPYNYIIGTVIMAIALWVIVLHAGYFRKYDTPIRPFEESTYLIKEGLYLYTRNPIYLGMVVLLIGGAVFLGSLTPFFVFPIFFLMIDRNFVEKEEIILAQKFGKSYIDYKKSVRRWF